MKTLLSIVTVLLFLGCDSSQNTPAYETPDVSGHWVLAETEVVDYIPFLDQHPPVDSAAVAWEGSPYEFAITTDFIFSADSFYRVNYPMILIEAGKYSIDTAHLNFAGSAWPIHVNADTMLLYRNYEWDYFLKETYYRAHFDESVVSILKRDTINYAGLAGTWMLRRAYSYMYGTNYTLNFPHDLQDSIVLTREEILSTLATDRSVKVLTDGVKRKYTFDYIDGQLHLTPGSWFSGEDPDIHFRRKRE